MGIPGEALTVTARRSARDALGTGFLFEEGSPRSPRRERSTPREGGTRRAAGRVRAEVPQWRLPRGSTARPNGAASASGARQGRPQGRSGIPGRRPPPRGGAPPPRRPGHPGRPRAGPALPLSTSGMVLGVRLLALDPELARVSRAEVVGRARDLTVSLHRPGVELMVPVHAGPGIGAGQRCRRGDPGRADLRRRELAPAG